MAFALLNLWCSLAHGHFNDHFLSCTWIPEGDTLSLNHLLNESEVAICHRVLILGGHFLNVQVKISREETQWAVLVARFIVTLHELHKSLEAECTLVDLSLEHILYGVHKTELMPVANRVQMRHSWGILAVSVFNVHLVGVACDRCYSALYMEVLDLMMICLVYQRHITKCLEHVLLDIEPCINIRIAHKRTKYWFLLLLLLWYRFKWEYPVYECEYLVFAHVM